MHMLLCQLNNEYRIAQVFEAEGKPTSVGLELSAFLSHYRVEELRLLALNAEKTGDAMLLADAQPVINTHNAVTLLEDLRSGTMILEDMYDLILNPFVDWTYVVDLDLLTFEIYCANKGNHKIYPDNRFYGEEKQGLRPAIKIASYSIGAMPTIDSMTHIERILTS